MTSISKLSSRIVYFLYDMIRIVFNIQDLIQIRFITFIKIFVKQENIAKNTIFFYLYSKISADKY